MFFGDARPLVGNCDLEETAVALRGNPNFGTAASASVAHGVGEKIVEQLYQLVEIAGQLGEVRFDVDL